MIELIHQNPEAMHAELAYRRSRLLARPRYLPLPDARWRRRRAPRSD